MPIVIFIVMLLILAIIVALRTIHFKPAVQQQGQSYPESNAIPVAEKLARAVRIATISKMDGKQTDGEAFLQLHALLETMFPLVHQQCEKTVINQYSLLYHYASPNSQADKKPILITAHMDVVPIEPNTANEWRYPPFSGDIQEGYVWGRGTLDTKTHFIAAMEALENILQSGNVLKRDVYFAFGHDEEINGEAGAMQIVKYLQEKQLQFEFVLDEGGCIVRNVLDGIQEPIAMVGIGEKGFANIRLTVNQDGGHASVPARHTSLGILAKALCKLEAYPFRPRLTDGTRAFLYQLGPYMQGLDRVILANLWLFQPLFIAVFSRTKTGSALLRTTVAVTMAQGSQAPNVVPQQSNAYINCRILPGENGNDLLAHIRKVLRKLPVMLEPIVLDDPSAISPTDCDAYRFVAEQIHEVCPNAIVAPYLVMAGTDARKYEAVCDHIYRFTPYLIENDDLSKIHGANECISIVNVNRCHDFFTKLFSKI